MILCGNLGDLVRKKSLVEDGLRDQKHVSTHDSAFCVQTCFVTIVVFEYVMIVNRVSL